ncbi:MAG: hypothetical protein ACKV2Q_31575 [Planctomycetaceae bacterium]
MEREFDLASNAASPIQHQCQSDKTRLPTALLRIALDAAHTWIIRHTEAH